MKTLVLAVSLLAAITSTAFAQSAGSYGNESIGYDPDPQVRFELRRDAHWLKGG
jgi:hypothetical protein